MQLDVFMFWQIGAILWNMKTIQSIYQMPGGPVAMWAGKKIYALFVLGYALVSFCLFTYDNYLHVSYFTQTIVCL